jgi:hypothetical protein
MLPRDKGGVVDPRLKVSNRIKLPAHVDSRMANFTPPPYTFSRRYMERTTCASSIFLSSHCTLVLPRRVGLVTLSREVLLIWCRPLQVYVYGMAEQGKGDRELFFSYKMKIPSLIADLCFPAGLFDVA